MGFDTAFDILLCLLIIATAIGAVCAHRLFSGVSLFIVYGLLLAIGWVRLDAVDVALAEAAIGAGLTGILLLGAVARLEPASLAPSRPSLLPMLPAVAITALLAWLVFELAGDTRGLQQQVAASLDESGAENPVTAVLLAFRAYDTLLETVVLLVALVAVWSLTPDALWRQRPGIAQHVRPDGVLATFGRLLPPFGLLIGIYLVWVGASAPGGAFQGGTVLAAVWLLAMMAGIATPPLTAATWLRWALICGPLLFLMIGACGLAWGSFLVHPPGFAKPTILVIELGLTISIASTLALLLLGPPRRAP